MAEERAMSGADIDRFRSAIVRSFPALAGAAFRFLPEGWHSVAVEADGRFVFKFPKDEKARRALLREAALLEAIRPRVRLPVPAMRIHRGPPIFSSHEKLEGEQLLAAEYRTLPEEARDRLARDLARFYAELHRLDIGLMKAAGAEPIGAWETPEDVRRKAVPALPEELREAARRTVRAYERLPPDPRGTIYGFFDGHGWNMAFDHARGVLNGVYDFADSGLGPLHQEFVYSSFIARDLTERIVAAYERMSGLTLDRRRIAVLTGFHRLSELASLADDPRHRPAMIRSFADWIAEGEAPE